MSHQTDNAGVDVIYKINFLKAMLMAQEVWNAVLPAMVKNCWKHADIQWLAITFHLKFPMLYYL